MLKLIRRQKIVLIAALIALLFTSISLPGIVTPVSAKTSSCSLTIRSLESELRWLRSLEDSYEQSMYFANEPLHREYHEEHLENAQDTLVLIVNTVYRIGNLLESLSNCSGLGNYTYEEFEQIMTNILLQLSTDFYNRDIGLEKYGFNDQYSRMIRNLKKLEDHDEFKDLYRNVVLNNPTVRDTTDRYTRNLLLGLVDRTLYRLPSLDKDAALISNMSIIADGALLAKQHIEDFIKNMKTLSLDPQYEQNQKGKLKEAGKLSFGKIAIDNLKTMGLRAVYKTAIEQQMIYPNMDPTQKAFSEDFAGNLASFMISTDLISFALSYTEMVGDLYDYINDQIGKVYDAAKANLDEYERLKEDAANKQQLFVKVNDFAQELGRMKMEPSLTEAQYVKKFDQSYKKLLDEVKDIYRVDRSVLKIYLNGKPLVIPEKAYIENGTTMVPMRVIAEEMGVEPIWDGKNRTITIMTSRNMLSLGKPMEVVFTIGSKNVKLGQYGYSSVPVAPAIKKGVTFVPLAFIAENLGLKVEYVAASHSVVLTSR